MVWDLLASQMTAKLEGHAAAVTAVTVTPDGAWVVSGSVDRTVKVWELATGRVLATLEGHTGRVTAVAVTPDGTRVVSGSEDSTVKVWTLETGQLETTLAGQAASVTTVGALSPRLPHMLFNIQRGGPELQGHIGAVTTVAVTPDGMRVVSGSVDRTVKVWDLATGQPEATLRGHTRWVTAVAVTPDGMRLVSGSVDRTLKVWDLASGQVIAQFHADGQIEAVACVGSRLFIAGAADGLHILELEEA